MSSGIIDIVVQLTDKNTQAGLSKIAATSKGAVSQVAKLKTELAGIGATAGITGLAASLAKDALAWNLSVKKLQSLTGATAEQASSLMAIASYMGVATDVSTASFAKFAKSISGAKDKMYEAAAEGKTSTDVLSKLGLTLDDVKGKNSLEVFKQIQERLRGMKDGAEKTRIEMELFGKSGHQLHGMLNMSADAMKQVEERAKAMGLIIDDEAAKKSAAFNRQLKDMEQTGKRLAIMIGQEVLPVVMDYTKTAIDLAKSYSSLATEQKAAIAGVLKFGVEAGAVITIIRSITSALGFMRLATIAAAGPWITIATVAGLAGKAILDARYAAMTGASDLGVTTEAGLKAHTNTNDTSQMSEVAKQGKDTRYWVEDTWLGIFKSDRLATEEEGKQIDAAREAKAKLEAAQKEAEEKQAQAEAEYEKAMEALKNGSADADKVAEKAAKEQEKAAKAQEQAAEKMAQAAERMSEMLRSLTLQSLEIDGSQYEIDKLQAKNQYESNNKNILDIIKSAANVSGGGYGAASGVLEAANAQLGKAYVLGADGTWATDCGKLFADSVKATFGKDVPRYVPSIMDAAAAAGAWHPTGDGYLPKAGDGVVVLGDNHIVISDGKGGYTGANSSTGVVAKQSVEGDFGAVTGYVDTSKLVGIVSGATASDVAMSSANAKALAESNLVAQTKAKNEEVYQKKLAEAERNQAIRVRKMNEDIAKLDFERTGDRLQLIKAEAEAQQAAVNDNLRQFNKEVGDKTLAEKRAQAERLKIVSDTEQKIRELAYTQANEAIEHQSNLVKLSRISQSDADALLAEELQSYIDFANAELAEAKMNATQRLQVEKNLLEAQQKLWEIAGRSLKQSLQEGVRLYQQEVVNYGDLAKSTFDSTMSSINSSFTSHLESMAQGTESFSKGLKGIFKDLTSSIIKMLVNLSFQQYLQPKLQGMFGNLVGSFGGGKTSFANSAVSAFSGAFTSGGGGFKKFATGGVAPAGMTLVGENGPELLQFNSSHRIYNASQTRKMIGGGENKVTVNIINQSGQQLDSKQTDTRFDGEQMIVDVVVSSLMTNKGGMRDAIKAAAM